MPLSDDLMGQAQTQSRSLAGSLGGDEGIEDGFDDLRGCSWTVIDDLDNDLGPDSLGRDDDGASTLERFGGVSEQIGPHLVPRLLTRHEAVRDALHCLHHDPGIAGDRIGRECHSRHRLVDKLADHMTEEMMKRGGRVLPSDLEALPESIRINWKLFGEAGVEAQALARVLAERVSDGGRYSETDESRNRTEALRNALNALRPDFTPEELQAVTALIRMHVSFHAWYRLTHEFDLDSDTAGRVSSWAFRVMRDALVSGDDPFR